MVSLKWWFLLLFLSIVWGTSFFLIKKGLIALTPLELGTLRMASAAIFLIPWALFSLKKAIRLSKEKMFYVLLSGIFGMFIPFILFPIAQTRISSGLTGVLNAAVPLFVLIIAFSFFKARFKKINFIGVFVGFLGVTFLILGEFSLSALSEIDYYAFYVILCTISYAININLVKFKIKNFDIAVLTSFSFFFPGVLAGIILMAGTEFSDHLLDWDAHKNSIVIVVILGVVNSSLAMLLFNKIIKGTNPLFASSVTYIVPVIAVIIGSFDGETLTFVQIVSIAIILTGVYLVNKK